jgi:hypothetical protein
MYKYAAEWRRNHENNHTLKMTTGWELNMLWSEKLWLLKDAVADVTDVADVADVADVGSVGGWIAWCDVGYFRNGRDDVHTNGGLNYVQWASPKRMAMLDPSKIYYSIVNNNPVELGNLRNIINNRDPITRLSKTPIPPAQVSIGGGFCLLKPNMIDDWCTEYEFKLEDYFLGKRLVKDDQMILVDCIFTNPTSKPRFYLVAQHDQQYNPWFVFQRFLM